MKNTLNFNDVSFSYHTKDGELLALKNLNFDIGETEFVAIVGPSGCGKTTILSLISGLLKPSSGSIKINGKEASIKSSEIGYMFQRDQLFEWRTIWKNVTLGLELQKAKKNENSINYIKTLLEKYGLAEFVSNKPSQLSGGMRQRVALIRTLAQNPSTLLLDEPFSALDYQTRLNVCDDVSKIIKTEKKTAILVTHDISEAISMSDRIVVLTKRPAEIKKIITIDLDKEISPLKRRESPKFREYFDQIWKELKDEKKID